VIVGNLTRMLILSLTLFLINCSDKRPGKNLTFGSKTGINKPNNESIKTSAKSWFDSAMKEWNKTSNNELVRSAFKDSSINEEWDFDGIIKTDTANYFVYKVGHDFSDQDGLRFITDAWIYVDTAKHKLYEYQIADEKLLEWEPKRRL